eukprot:TRINITY_DN10297_c0_g3_i1.p1 TRINITY_DN10297_c0_g3~~TRINITY_DN10297_c0_g3_i1.p1  ORF type:complete len:542 (-),score=97.58 TRINITY_DN10297_c0_g3_i1:217-1842(-)
MTFPEAPAKSIDDGAGEKGDNLLQPFMCNCACNSDGVNSLSNLEAVGEVGHSDMTPAWPPSRARQSGLISYAADLTMPLLGAPIRTGEVWHLLPEDGKSFEQAQLSLHANGIFIKPSEGKPPLSIAWSPFSLVQACRLHSVQADAALPWLRLFKVSVFQHGSTHFFAAQGTEADAGRARWVADVSRSLRVVTQSLFPEFVLRSHPLQGAAWTATRLLAGYLLLCDDQGVSLVYCELHCHWDGAATFAAYEDEYCDTQVVRLGIDMHTCVSERVGVDCSCFSFDGYHFTTRSCAEKMLWLRAISNVKVKLRHRAPNPSPEELAFYRSSINEYAHCLRPPPSNSSTTPLLPLRAPRRGHLSPGATSMQGPGPSGPIASVIGGPQPAEDPESARGDSGPPGLMSAGPPPNSRLQNLPSPHKLSVLMDGKQDPDGDSPSPLPPEPPAPSSARGLSGGTVRSMDKVPLLGPVPPVPSPPTFFMAQVQAESSQIDLLAEPTMDALPLPEPVKVGGGEKPKAAPATPISRKPQEQPSSGKKKPDGAKS